MLGPSLLNLLQPGTLSQSSPRRNRPLWMSSDASYGEWIERERYDWIFFLSDPPFSLIICVSSVIICHYPATFQEFIQAVSLQYSMEWKYLFSFSFKRTAQQDGLHSPMDSLHGFQRMLSNYWLARVELIPPLLRTFSQSPFVFSPID